MTEAAIYEKAAKLRNNLLFRMYCYVQPRFWMARKAFADRHKPGADFTALTGRAWELTGHPIVARGLGTTSQLAMRWLARGRN